MPVRAPVDFSKPINYAALKDRNVLLTGGSSGFGAAFARMFVENGANLVIADLQDGPGKKIEQELAGKGANVKFVKTDVSSFDSQVAMLREALDFFPRNEVDVFVPCAGILLPPTQIDPQDPAELANLSKPSPDLSGKIINVNLNGAYTGTLLVTRYGMGLHKPDRASEGPAKSIVLIGSLAGYTGASACIEYTTTKFGIRGILRGLRKQAATLGVRLNLVAPFYVETPMTTDDSVLLKKLGIPMATVAHVVEATARAATDENAWGRSIFVMPEGLSDAGDDAEGLQSGKAFSVETLGDHWALLVHGPMSDEIEV